MALRDIPTNFDEAYTLLNNKPRKVVANNTYLERVLKHYNSIGNLVPSEYGHIALVHHATTIAEYYPDGSVWVGHQGYNTMTTKQRINVVLRPTPYRMYNHRVGEAWLHKFGKPVRPMSLGVHVASDGETLLYELATV